MNKLGIGELTTMIGGRLRLGNLPPLGGELEPLGRFVCDCSRVEPGDLFWELPSESNCKAYAAEEALARGAQGVIVTGRHVEPWAGRFCVEVEDGRVALWQLAASMRHRYTGQVVAVAGSVHGSMATTMIDAVLNRFDRKSCVTASPDEDDRNLPLKFLKLDSHDDYAVLKLHLAADNPLAAQTQLCRPHVGVVTDIDGAHVSPWAIVKEMFEALPADGCAVLNGDDTQLRRAAAGIKRNIIWVGRGTACDLQAENICFADGRLSFTVEEQRIEVSAIGRHQLHSALAAYTVGRLHKIDATEIALALSKIEIAQTSSYWEIRDDVTVICETNRSGSGCLVESLGMLRDYRAAGKRIVVCGDVAADPQDTETIHQQIGRQVVTIGGADMLVAFGSHAEALTLSARQAGMSHERAVSFPQDKQAVSWLNDRLDAGDVVVVYDHRSQAIPIQQSENQHAPVSAGNESFEAGPLTSLLRESSVALPPG